MKYAWIRQHRCVIDVPVLQVSQSAYYGWLHRIPSFREREDGQLSGIVKMHLKKAGIHMARAASK